MDRELTFHPQTEPIRDLIYSEYSSCDRSIHLLFQESPAFPYELVLEAYRVTVSAYLSFENLRPPVDFLEDLLSRYDALSRNSAVGVDRWRSVGIHVVLRSVDGVYIVTSRESEILVHSDGGLATLADSTFGRVERLHFDSGNVQRELFPTSLGAFLSVLKLESAAASGATLVLGCGDGERQAVIDGLSVPAWAGPSGGEDGRAVRQSLVSPLVKHRILALRFGASAEVGARVAEVGLDRSPRMRWKPLQRRRWGTVAGGLALTVIVAVLWTSRSGGPRHGDTPRSSGKAVRAPMGHAPETKVARPGSALPTERRDVQLAEVWRKTYPGEVTSSPVLFEGCVVFGCRDGRLYALERTSGAMLWTFRASAGIGASPVVRGGRVFIADYNGKVYAVDGRTGKELWSTRLPAKVVSSPQAVEDRVIVGCFDGYAYALGSEDGTTLWKRQTKGRIRGSPASAGGRVFMPSYDGFLYALSIADGSVMWRSNLGGAVASSPAVDEGLVVVGGSDGKIYGLDAVTGAKRWICSTGGAVRSSVVISAGRIFAGSNDRVLYCLNLVDGSLAWKFRTGDVVLGRPLVQDAIVYAGSYDGRVYALEAASGRLVDSFDTGGEVYSSPAGDDDGIYVGTNRGDFICLSVGRKELP